jgi:hypothetical protein
MGEAIEHWLSVPERGPAHALFVFEVQQHFRSMLA